MLIETGFETEMSDLVVQKPRFYTGTWMVGFGGSVSTAGVIKDDLMYFGCCDHYIYALDLKTRETLWKFRASGGFVEARPVIHDDVFYLGNYDGYMYALNIKNGKLVWRFKTGDRITSSVFIYSGKAYFGSFDGNLYCLDSNGK
jgi:outer membrane protein assembly factor BamB